MDKCVGKLDVSATMTSKKSMQYPHEIRVDEESKLTLHGLLQYYVKLAEKVKNRKLNDLLDALELTSRSFWYMMFSATRTTR